MLHLASMSLSALVLRVEIAGPQDMKRFSFNIAKLYQFDFHQMYMSVPVTPHPCKHLVFSIFKFLLFWWRYSVIPMFSYISLKTNEMESHSSLFLILNP